MKQYYETINIVYLMPEECYGTVETLGVYGSIVNYTKNDVDYSEMFENEEFVIVNEIVLEHVRVCSGSWHPLALRTHHSELRPQHS